MIYTLDVSGRLGDGRPCINRFGGLFMTVEQAMAHGRWETKSGARLWFKPEWIWVRDEDGEVARREGVKA